MVVEIVFISIKVILIYNRYHVKIRAYVLNETKPTKVIVRVAEQGLTKILKHKHHKKMTKFHWNIYLKKTLRVISIGWKPTKIIGRVAVRNGQDLKTQTVVIDEEKWCSCLIHVRGLVGQGGGVVKK